ncbi:uncharacterized protein [Ptychodera flava]|uniref:uncharacterized protein n=1 Tax=Ptychodera flava TaxID=63121 RepID=UPI00396A0D2A
MANLHPRRVMLWAYPRSLSTAFEFSLASRQETEVFHELYTLAYHFGEERVSRQGGGETRVPGYFFKDVIKTLESDCPGKDVMICKDMAYCLDGKYGRLPKDYIHTFLIRDPRRSIASLCKTYIAFDAPLELMPSSGGVKQLYDLHNYVTDTLKQKSIIIDAGDLANYPEKIIRKYCEAVGIPYCDNYINWKENDLEYWHMIWKQKAIRDVCHSQAVKSTHFKSNLHNNQPVDVSEVPHQGQLQIEAALPYYNELFQKRIRP